MFEEGVEIMKRMWTDSPASFSGRYYSVDAVHCEPRPDPLPILMLGGAGERKTMRVVAEHADWWNMTMGTPEALQHKLDVLRGHCEAVGRDYDSIRKTLAPRFYIHKVHSKALEMAGDKANDSTAVIAGDPAAVREKAHGAGGAGLRLLHCHLPAAPGAGRYEALRRGGHATLPLAA